MGSDHHFRVEQVWPAGSVIEEIAALFPSPAACAWLSMDYQGRKVMYQRRPSYAKRRDEPKRFLVPLSDGRIVAVTCAVPPYHNPNSRDLAPEVMETAMTAARTEDTRAASRERVRAGAWWNKD